MIRTKFRKILPEHLSFDIKIFKLLLEKRYTKIIAFVLTPEDTLPNKFYQNNIPKYSEKLYQFQDD